MSVSCKSTCVENMILSVKLGKFTYVEIGAEMSKTRELLGIKTLI